MPTPEQIARLARVIAWLRTAKETLPAINHGPHAVPAEQIARASALLDRMYRQALPLSAALGAGPADAAGAAPVGTRAPAAGRQAA